MRISDWSSDVCSSDLLAALKRKLFPAQADVVHAVTELLVDRGERAAIVNGEMGCGKTTVGIATAAMLNAEGYRRTLVLSPPHLVRSEEHTSELQSLMRNSYAVFCLTTQKTNKHHQII